MFKSGSEKYPHRPDEAIELTIYPFTKFNDWLLPSYPSIKDDPGKQLETVRNFNTRSDDILLCTIPKAGTHWLGEIINMVVDKTTDYNHRPDSFRYHLDFITDYSFLEEENQSRRVLRSHLPYDYIPSKHIELGAKIIYLNRNPKDRHVSLYNFFKKLRGFPIDWKWEEYFDEIVRHDIFIGGWWEYTRQFEKAMQTNPNILPVTFEEMKLDPVEQIQRIGHFLGEETTKDFAKLIAEKTTFENLKEHLIDSTGILTKDFKPTLFRKGEIGDWKNYFTVAQNEEFDSMCEKEMYGFDVKFIYEYPPK